MRFARHFALALTGAACLALPTRAGAWGDHGHRLIGLAAAQQLPDDMPAFFRNAAQQLSYLNPEPDRWKDRRERQLDPALDDGTFPEHFIDADLVPDSVLRQALKAPNRWAYADTLRAAGVSAQTMGVLPFQILELAQKLRGDFRMWRIAPDSTVRAWIEQRIIDDAGILGHYIADGSNPAHTTRHYNGWVGDNPKGYATDPRFHGRFESAFVQSHLKLADVVDSMTAPVRVFPNLRPAIIAYLDTSFALVEPMYALDKRTPFGPETATAEQKAFAASRLAAGARMLRDVWYTAWVTSAPAAATPR